MYSSENTPPSPGVVTGSSTSHSYTFGTAYAPPSHNPYYHSSSPYYSTPTPSPRRASPRYHSQHTNSYDNASPRSFYPGYNSNGLYETPIDSPKAYYSPYSNSPPYSASPPPGRYQHYAAEDGEVIPASYSPRRRRASTSVPQRPSTVRPSTTVPRGRKATEKDARKHMIPAGYSLKNWDPTEEPILLLGSVFEANSLEKWLKDWTLAQPKPKPRRKQTPNRRKALRIIIKGTEHLACPDSGSQENIMTESFATTHDLPIRRRPQDRKSFELGNGKHVYSTGRVRVRVQLAGKGLSGKKRTFYILPTCPVPLILGMPFLKETEVLGKNKHMLEEYPAEMSKISSLLWIGSPRQRQTMSCELDGRTLTADADTGSDLNLMSLKCAKREGFTIDRRRECRRRVRVGDGSEAETIGQVRVYNLSLDWRKDETPISDLDFDDTFSSLVADTEDVEDQSSDADSASQGVVFHVLPDLPCDLIFGRSLLEQTDAFNLCPSLSSAEPALLQDGTKHRTFHVLISLGPVSLNLPISRRKRRAAAAAVQVNSKEKHDDERHAEMFLRSRKEDEISRLPAAEQGLARAKEIKRVKEWEGLHANCTFCNPV